MNGIQYINRATRQIETEEVWKEDLLQFFYGPTTLAKLLLYPLAGISLFSKIVGYYQTLSLTKKDIVPFITRYKVDATEFLEPVDSFGCFNDFFIRKLKAEVRPISNEAAVIPADGRYLFYQNIDECPYVRVKGERFTLADLLGSEELANEYADGSAVMGRLCPTDYHRFHFPIDCIPSEPRLINGSLFSVNPIALRVRPSVFYENKRMLTLLESPIFGQVAMIEFGATNVGSIIETFTPNRPVKKGDEKGYFSFGGSALMILFKKGALSFSEDLLNHDLEMRCLLGQPLGTEHM